MTKSNEASKQPGFPFHPAAEVFPLLQGKDFDELVEDIKKHGLREPITVHEEMILDGRNRYRACVEAGARPHYRAYQGDDPIAFVISANIRRRHLDAKAKRDLIAKLLKMYPAKSDRQIGKQVNADNKTVAKERAGLKAREEIPHVDKREDSKGRKQPATKERATPRASKGVAAVGAPEPEVVPVAPIVAPPQQTATEHAIRDHFNRLYNFCNDLTNWPAPMSEQRRARLGKVMQRLLEARDELFKLARAPKGPQPVKPESDMRQCG